MSTITVFGLDIPGTAPTLDEFRAWAAALGENSPRVHYSRGRLHIEMGQDWQRHGPLVSAVNDVLSPLARQMDLGRYYEPPTWITSPGSDLSTEPDGFLVLWASFESGAVHASPTRVTEMLGRPDMALEVVSKTSVRKDLVELVEDYARAGVREYWVADSRGPTATLRILVLGTSGTYEDQPALADGWIASPLWRHGFRLVSFVDRAGLPDFRLEARRA